MAGIKKVPRGMKIKSIRLMTIREIYYELFKKHSFFINSDGCIGEFRGKPYDIMNCNSKNQCKKLIAINKVLNLSEYFNQGKKGRYSFKLEDNKIIITKGTLFYNIEDARLAIKILDEDTVKMSIL